MTQHFIDTAIQLAQEYHDNSGCEFCDGGDVGQLCGGCWQAMERGDLHRCVVCRCLYDHTEGIDCACKPDWDLEYTVEEARDEQEERFRRGAEPHE